MINKIIFSITLVAISTLFVKNKDLNFGFKCVFVSGVMSVYFAAIVANLYDLIKGNSFESRVVSPVPRVKSLKENNSLSNKLYRIFLFFFIIGMCVFILYGAISSNFSWC